MACLLKRFLRAESGATALEYSLIAGSVSIVIVTAANLLGTTLTSIFTSLAGAL
jgi:pilus assembly protein Flp/PilA